MSSTKLMKQQIIPLFFSLKGRISRGLFLKSNLVLFLGYLTLFIFLILAEQILGLSSEQFGIGGVIIISFYWYIVFVLTVKRLHDINWSGWLALPIIMTGIIWIFIGLINGKITPNRHGENPIEYEKKRLYINKHKGLPPPPPPLDNPISKFLLYVMMISFLPSLIMAGIILPEKIEEPIIEQSEMVTASEKDTTSIDEALYFDESKYLAELMNIYNNPNLAPEVVACKGDIYCNTFIELSKKWKSIPDSYRYKGSFDIKAQAKSGITFDDQGRNIGLQRGFYFYNEQTNKIIDGVEILDNIPDDYEGGLAILLYIEDNLQSSEVEKNIQEKKSLSTFSSLPFIGEREFNFMGGLGTGYTIKVNSDGHTQINACGIEECINIYNGNYVNPIRFDDGSGFLFRENKIYSLPAYGEVVEEGCQNYESDKCVSDLYYLD